MSFILLTAIMIGWFAFGGALYLMWRHRDWRIAFLAAMAAVVVLREATAHLGAPLTWTISFPGPNQDLPGLMVSIMVWVAMFFLDRMIRDRRRAEEGLQFEWSAGGWKSRFTVGSGSIRLLHRRQLRKPGQDGLYDHRQYGEFGLQAGVRCRAGQYPFGT